MQDTAVKAMFETIAQGYDLQNSVLSLGRDLAWRRSLARSIKTAGPAVVVDVAVGTAEVALSIGRAHPLSQVIGVDFSPAMLARGQHKLRSRGSQRIALTAGDGRRLPLRDGSADVVTIAFGIRNIEERHQALAEFHRILKPGGQLLIMDFSYPSTPLLKGLYRFYLHHILPPVGNWLSRTDYAYSYLADSIGRFPVDVEFLAEIGRAGFSQRRVTKLTFGIAKIFHGTKEQA